MCLSIIAAASGFALDNGVALTPPMGVNPYNSIAAYNEQMWKMTAEAMAANGMKAAGYQYVNTDCGCWHYRTDDEPCRRNADGTLVVDAEMIPNGLKPLADHIHGLGLKIGLYHMPALMDETAGSGNIETDANSWAQWGIDYVKWDGWTGSSHEDFVAMREAVLATGRPIVFSINGERGAELANMWRTSGDIDPDWGSVMECIGTHATGGGVPGGWPDPDMMEVGNMNNETEEMTHFSLWCVTSSPLLAGNDIRAMFLSTHYILLNAEAIAVNQDTAFAGDSSYGGSGKRVKQSGNLELWLKTVTGGAKAVVLVNTGAAAATLTVNWSDIGLPAGVAQVRDLWEHRNLGPFTDSYSAEVPSHGCKFLKIVAGSDPIPEPPATWFPKPEDPTAITPLPRTGWTATSNLGNPSVYIDGDIETPVMSSNARDENWIAIDMESPQTFNCVMLNSAISGVGTAFKPYRVYRSVHNLSVYVSDDGTEWRGPVYEGSMGPKNYAAMMFEEQRARYVKIVNTLSSDCQKTGWANDLTWAPFDGEDGQQVTEVYVADVGNLSSGEFSDVPYGFWAYVEIYACREAGVVEGYPDDTYRPEIAVTRDQMAVYVARALAGGDANVPPGPPSASFLDMPTDHWAYRHVEYAKAQRVVGGSPRGLYEPSLPIDRAQMAVYMARAMVAPGGEGALAGYLPTDPHFPDVSKGFWAYKQVEYCADNGVAQGYQDGYYHPEWTVTRDQMAAYVQRAFQLPM
jgi:alpha-galactosidase